MKKIRKCSSLQDALSVWGIAENLLAPIIGDEGENVIVRIRDVNRRRSDHSCASIDGSFKCVANAFCKIIPVHCKRAVK